MGVETEDHVYMFSQKYGQKDDDQEDYLELLIHVELPLLVN